MPASAFWALSSEQARAEAAGTARGLSPEEAAARLRRWGPNELAPPRPLEALREIVRFRVNPLILILPAAAALLRFLLALVVGYLGLVEIVKRWFYRRYPM